MFLPTKPTSSTSASRRMKHADGTFATSSEKPFTPSICPTFSARWPVRSSSSNGPSSTSTARPSTQASYLPDIVDGQVQGFYVQVTDVTARVEAEHARDAAQRLFEISMANAPFGKAVLTTSARTLQINPALCALLGYCAEESIHDFRELVHPEDRRLSADACLKHLQDQSVPQVASERRYVRRDGTTIWMQRNAVLVQAHTAARTSSSLSSKTSPPADTPKPNWPGSH